MQTRIKNKIVCGCDLNLIAVISISALVLVMRYYYPLHISFPAATDLIYYLLVPLAAGWLLFRDKPRDYGMCIGHWKSAALLISVSLAVMAPILYGVSQMPEFRSYYCMPAIDWSELLLNNALFFFAWEFLLRGYLLFGLEKSIGKSAIFVQAIPFVLLHLRKPLLETLFCIPGGFILGYVAYRTRSFLPCFIIHFGIYVMIILFTNS